MLNEGLSAYNLLDLSETKAWLIFQKLRYVQRLCEVGVNHHNARQRHDVDRGVGLKNRQRRLFGQKRHR